VAPFLHVDGRGHKAPWSGNLLGTFLLLTRCTDITNQEMKMKKTKKTALNILVTTFAFLGAACNTITGVGQDLESVGNKAEEVTR